MFFLWSIASLSLIIKFCTSQQFCIDSCSFHHNFDEHLTLPPNCTLTQRHQCDVILTFDYSTRIVNIQFGSYAHKQQQRDDMVYTSELITHTIITLDGDSSAQNIVEYYCSTGDRCEYEYAINQVLSLYIQKTCHRLRVNLISLLHSDPSSSSRSCMVDDGDASICDQPCYLLSINPNETRRTCDRPRNLEFETTIGRTTPTNKPEYSHRLYAYACTTELCNGNAKQQQIEKLLKSDDGECFLFLEDGNQTIYETTPIPHNQTIIYSNSILLYIICFLMLFY